ncbi:MAG: DNA mismatch repair endonuclease MutL [Firmicutes bacterium]|nr:DNA mismatch repair endonuclease MutL [Bacillota bacterium]
MRINILPKDVADKIAAGEVIERPVSVVKELVENAIDAGSTDIIVEIIGGGKESIRVSDNGSGIEKDDVEKAFLRHATSKIRATEDLRKLDTLGFRGEALASIAAVSRVELITKTEDARAGERLLLHGGETISSESIGCPRGTTIIVRDLFYNLPARLKFMKSEAAESGQIIDMVSRLAITRTDIRFKLISNGKAVFSTLGNGDLKAAILAVYKDSEYKELISCERQEGKLKVHGYISRPSFSRANRRSQYFFVNGRTVKSSVIEKGLSLGYKERLFDGRYPIAFLFLDVDPALVDVNIHPNKREVKFDDDVAVTSLVRDAVIDALTKRDAVVTSSDSSSKFEEKVSSYTAYKTKDKTIANIKNHESESNRIVDFESGEQVGIRDFLSSEKRTEKRTGKKDSGLNAEAPDSSSKSAGSISDTFGTPDIEKPINQPFDFDELKFGEIIFDTYITATDEDNFYLFDQHAAHERINYEKFIAAYLNEEKNSQLLLLPIIVDVPAEILDEDGWQEALKRMGFSLELFGENSFVFREIPEFIEIGEAEGFIRTFIDEYAEGNTLRNHVVIDKLITKACKSSIKAHDTISKEEVDALIDELKNCENPFSCPHGRPTFVKFRLYDIERMFKRVQG